MKIRNLLFLTTVLIISCKSYREDVMFQVEQLPPHRKITSDTTRNYLITPNDRLLINIFTGKGEKLIDPNPQLSDNQVMQKPEETEYIIRDDGYVKLPMIGKIRLAGLSLEQASDQLEQQYATYYNDPYVLVRFVNKRVTVLGATAGQVNGQVISLSNDQMRVSEVLAIAGGLTRQANAGNIRLLRDDQVKILNLSTFEGYLENDLVVEPGDIIYVEPVRRPVSEFFRENYPMIGLTTGIISLISVIISLNN